MADGHAAIQWVAGARIPTPMTAPTWAPTPLAVAMAALAGSRTRMAPGGGTPMAGPIWSRIISRARRRPPAAGRGRRSTRLPSACRRRRPGNGPPPSPTPSEPTGPPELPSPQPTPGGDDGDAIIGAEDDGGRGASWDEDEPIQWGADVTDLSWMLKPPLWGPGATSNSVPAGPLGLTQGYQALQAKVLRSYSDPELKAPRIDNDPVGAFLDAYGQYQNPFLSVGSSGTHPSDAALHYGMQGANVVSLIDLPVSLWNLGRMGLNGVRWLRGMSGASKAKNALEGAEALRGARTVRAGDFRRSRCPGSPHRGDREYTECSLSRQALPFGLRIKLLLDRATKGIDPWTGKLTLGKNGKPNLVDSTRFNSFQDMAEAIEKASRSVAASFPNGGIPAKRAPL